MYENKDDKTRIKLDKEGLGMQYAEEFLMPYGQYSDKIKEIQKQKQHVSCGFTASSKSLTLARLNGPPANP